MCGQAVQGLIMRVWAGVGGQKCRSGHVLGFFPAVMVRAACMARRGRVREGLGGWLRGLTEKV